MQLEVINNALTPKWSQVRAYAYQAWTDHCTEEYWEPNTELAMQYRSGRLLTPPGANTKLAKGTIPIYGLTLAPAGLSGYQVCPWRSPECEAACLGVTAGRSRFSNVQEARIRKTRLLFEDSYAFFRILFEELSAAKVKHGLRFAFRSNVLSDIVWESICPWMYYYSWLNYDYTKSFSRAVQSLDRKRGFILDLTLSFSGHNWDECETYLRMGGKVAAVFNIPKDEPFPETWCGFPVVDGDRSDMRIDDPRGCVVGLRAKGKINRASAFVLSVT